MRPAALAGALALSCGACDTGVRGIALGPLDANPQCEEAKTHQDLPWIQSHIFDKHCSSSTACHQDSIDDTDHLQLTDGTSFTNLVGVDAQAMVAVQMPHGDGSKWLRVAPGDPANSYLMVLIDPLNNPSGGPTDPNGFDGPLSKMTGSMPASAGELLCPEQIDAIKRWIASGAPEQ